MIPATENKHLKILVIDDDPLCDRYYSRLLQQHPGMTFEIDGCYDGETALAKLREDTFDCALLDFQLPDMTGLECLQNLVTDKPPCAVILTTGYGSEAIAVECMKHGAQDYLSKDKINANNLYKAIIQAVTQNELRKHLANSLQKLTEANQALEQEAASRKAVEDELRAAKIAADAANEAKTRFVAMVTHELRTPLNGILGYAQLLRLDGTLSRVQEERVNSMMRAGQHLRTMIESVLDFASIEVGRFTLHIETVRVDELIKSCLAVIEPLAIDRMLTLKTTKSPELPDEIIVDHNRLQQVLLNLLGNAVKFTPSHGRIELKIQSTADTKGIRFEVIDTGPGIDAEGLDRLFVDFERSNALPSVEGAGLGLAIAARIVRLMDGQIGYQPNPSGGSLFWLEIPFEKKAVAEPPKQRPITPALTGLRILLAEDVPMNRDVIGAFLQMAGHEVTFANNGIEALQLAADRVFDLILMDVQMPQLDGLEATRSIRALPGQNSQIPIIALTAQSFKEQIAKCFDAGMNEYVVKPVDFSQLNLAIAKMVTKPAAPLQPAPSQRQSNTTSAMPPADFNRTKFDETAAFLPPTEVVDYLKWLRSHCKSMLQLFNQAAIPAPSVLNDTAHTLASTAGMFGFETLCALGRQYERAVLQNPEQAQELIQNFQSEILKTMNALDGLIHVHSSGSLH